MQPGYIRRGDDEKMGDEGPGELPALGALASGRCWRPARDINCIAHCTAETTPRDGFVSCPRGRYGSGERILLRGLCESMASRTSEMHHVPQPLKLCDTLLEVTDKLAHC